MNQDEHQRERMRLWARSYDGAEYADQVLAEFDKRLPAPVEPEPRIKIEWPACGDAELASLRQKARLWDAVASGKVRLYIADDSNFYVAFDTADDAIGGHQFPTAAEAVEAAIAAGALK